MLHENELHGWVEEALIAIERFQEASVAKMPPDFVLKICPLMLDLNLNHMLISIV